VCVCVCINDEHGQETGRLRDFSNCISFSKRLWQTDLIECERDNTAVAIYYCTYYIYIYLRCTFVRRRHCYIIHTYTYILLLLLLLQSYRKLLSSTCAVELRDMDTNTHIIF